MYEWSSPLPKSIISRDQFQLGVSYNIPNKRVLGRDGQGSGWTVGGYFWTFLRWGGVKAILGLLTDVYCTVPMIHYFKRPKFPTFELCHPNNNKNNNNC